MPEHVMYEMDYTQSVPNKLSIQIPCCSIGLHVVYIWVIVCLVVVHDSADPAVVAAHPGIDAGVSLHGTVITPGHNSLQLTVTDQRTARVSLQTQRNDEC